ncbi:MAG TPA: DUF1844 domain-containing protein [Gemmatimonadota bacterium]|nr:DUF1844 domain-containing protein [Gemmatimonadota bacterium]
MTENKFRERRSAFRDESAAAEPETPAPEPAADAAAERLERAATPPPEEVESDGPPSEASVAELDRMAEMDVPPPSFLELVEPHVEMAFRFLGELPLTPDGERRVLPRWAKREIDLLGILEQRTRGNLPPEEEQVLSEALDQLRTLYLKVVG